MGGGPQYFALKVGTLLRVFWPRLRFVSLGFPPRGFELFFVIVGDMCHHSCLICLSRA